MSEKRPASSKSIKMVETGGIKMVQTGGETHGYKPNASAPAAVRPPAPKPPSGQGGGSK